MTQETPSVEPNSTPENKATNSLITTWNSLSNGVKAVVIIAVIVLVIAVAGSGGGGNSTPTTSSSSVVTAPPTSSPSQLWNAWKSELAPVISQTQSDYTQTEADLSNADYEASTQDFASLSQDATDITALANGPDVAVNNDLLDVASSLHEIATTGISAMNSGDLAGFTAALDHYGKSTDKLAADLANANTLY